MDWLRTKFLDCIDCMISSLRWGLLGTGSIARKFAAELPHSKTGLLQAVGSRSQAAAESFGRDFPIKTAHGSYEALLADPDVDVIYISTPHPWHAEWAIKAAEAGKHILCEKPFTMNLAEAEAVIAAARAHDVFLMEAFMYRFHPRTIRVAELVRESIIGEVKLIEASFGFTVPYRPDSRLFDKSLGGGSILDVGCYTTSVARLVAGAATGKAFADPIDVRGMGILCESGVDTMSLANLKFPGGIVAQLSCGSGLKQANELVIYGERGRITAPVFWIPPGPITILDYATDTTSVVETDSFAYRYALQADAVAESLEARQSPLMSWDDTLGNMATLDAWRREIGLSYDADGQ